MVCMRNSQDPECSRCGAVKGRRKRRDLSGNEKNMELVMVKTKEFSITSGRILLNDNGTLIILTCFH